MATNHEEVIGQVQRALMLEPSLSAPRITVTMLDDTTLTLSGVLDDPQQVHRASQIARQAARGLTIDNSLTVANSRQTGGVDDTRLAPKAAEALEAAIELITGRPVRASVQVINGLAHLRGSCSTAKDRRFLCEAVSRVSGLAGVIADDLVVAPFGSADDIRLGNLAEERLQREAPGLSPVHVRVHERSAHLTGRVRTMREASRAVDVVMRQPGIKHVHNELECYQSETSGDADTRLEELIRHAIGQAGLPAPNLHVFVTRGLVTIDGEVDSPEQQRKLALLARGIAGVTQVDNLTKVADRRGEPPLPEAHM